MRDKMVKSLFSRLAIVAVLLSTAVVTFGCSKSEAYTVSREEICTEYSYQYFKINSDDFVVTNKHEHDSTCYDDGGNVICSMPESLSKGDIFYYMESCLFAYSFDDGRWVILDPEFRLSRLKEGLENKTIEYANDSDQTMLKVMKNS